MLLWLVGFFAGVLTEGLWSRGGYVVQATETAALQKVCQKDDAEVLNVVFYDDKGRKVLVHPDGILQLSESLCVEIPLSTWVEEQEGLVEIRVFYADGTEKRNRVHIQRKALHNGEK